MTVAEFYDAHVVRSSDGLPLPVDGRAVIQGTLIDPGVWLARPYTDSPLYALCCAWREGVTWVNGRQPMEEIASLVKAAPRWQYQDGIDLATLDRAVANLRATRLVTIAWKDRTPCPAMGCARKAGLAVWVHGQKLGEYCKSCAHRAIVRHAKTGGAPDGDQTSPGGTD